ncbi:hypothetical protein H0H87_001140 [Tephrocybe sp. NHM501043]|nr:hypothetical protein H0H87_001140 [Tephrocybe sp. NHM501043]
MVLMLMPKGETPLHLSTQQGHHEIVKFLVEHGADVNAKGEKKILGLSSLADFLQGLDDMTPLHESAHNGHYEIVKFLVEHDADVNAITSENTHNLLIDH